MRSEKSWQAVNFNKKLKAVFKNNHVNQLIMPCTPSINVKPGKQIKTLKTESHNFTMNHFKSHIYLMCMYIQSNVFIMDT